MGCSAVIIQLTSRYSQAQINQVQDEAEVVPSSSLDEVKVEIEIEIEVEVEVGVEVWVGVEVEVRVEVGVEVEATFTGFVP